MWRSGDYENDGSHRDLIYTSWRVDAADSVLNLLIWPRKNPKNRQESSFRLEFGSSSFGFVNAPLAMLKVGQECSWRLETGDWRAVWKLFFSSLASPTSAMPHDFPLVLQIYSNWLCMYIWISGLVTLCLPNCELYWTERHSVSEEHISFRRGHIG